MGHLSESGCFRLDIGWETPRIARRARGDADLSLEAYDDSGSLLAKGPVERKARYCGDQGLLCNQGERIVGHVVLHAHTRSVILLHGQRVLHRMEVHPERPKIESVRVSKQEDGKLLIEWCAEHSRPLSFSIAFSDEGKRAVVVARDLHDRCLLIDPASLSGGRGCIISVLATDGARSTVARSETFDLPIKPPTTTILEPQENAMIAPDQPFSLLGRAQDAMGRSLPEDGLVWSINNKVVATGRSLALGGPLAPGKYRIELVHRDDNRSSAVSRCQIEVAERTPEQEEWLRISGSVCAEPFGRRAESGAGGR